MDYYKRDLSELKMDMEMRDRFAGMQQDDVQVPSITQHLTGLMRGADVGKYESIPLAGKVGVVGGELFNAKWRVQRPFKLSDTVCKYYDCVYMNELDELKRAELLATMMEQDQFTIHDLNVLPYGVALPIKNALGKLRHSLSSSLPPLALEIVNRLDMLPQQSGRKKSYVHQDAVKSSAWLQLRSMACQRDMADVSNNAQGSGMGDYAAKYGGYMGNTTYAQRLREDGRVEEVRRILRTTDLTIMEPLRGATWLS